CFGMQMAVIEAARHLAGLRGAGSTEFGPCEHPVVGLMTEWMRGNTLERREVDGDLGGTMRLGGYEAFLEPTSRGERVYWVTPISERHRHRYEINIGYKDTLEQAGLCFSGISPDGTLPEIVELHDHPWFIGVQFHPELKSRPFEPHPLFTSFVKAALDQSRLVEASFSLRAKRSNLPGVALSLRSSQWQGGKMQPSHVRVGNVTLGNDLPLAFIVGPNTLESRAHALETSAALAEIARKFGVGLIYKTSFDKANRSSLSGQRGIGLEQGLPILAELRET